MNRNRRGRKEGDSLPLYLNKGEEEEQWGERRKKRKSMCVVQHNSTQKKYKSAAAKSFFFLKKSFLHEKTPLKFWYQIKMVLTILTGPLEKGEMKKKPANC